MIGFAIGSLVGLIIALAPSILILLNKNASGRSKALWFTAALIIPFIIKFIISVIVIAVQGNAMPYGIAFLIPVSWYLTAWTIYFYFKAKFRPIIDAQNSINSKAES